MNRITWGIGIILLLAALTSAYFLIRPTDTSAPVTTQTGTGNATVGANGESSIITYTDAGFSPSILTITPGTTVTWSNESTRNLQVTSTGDCTTPGGSFNECATISTGGTYSYTFTTPGTFSYHNQHAGSDTGMVTVTAPTFNPEATPQ